MSFFFFDNVEAFLKKNPLVSPLASSKTYGQLTPPARTSCQVIQRIIFEWEYSPPSGLKSPLLTNHDQLKLVITCKHASTGNGTEGICTISIEYRFGTLRECIKGAFILL